MGPNITEYLVYTKHAVRYNKYGVNSSYNLEMELGEQLLPQGTFSIKVIG